MPKAKQERLIAEGLNQEIVNLAEDYESIRNERMDLTKQESEAHQALLDAMHRNDLKEYGYEGKKIFIVGGKERVRVRSEKDDEEEESEE